jgi:hypothetical protein
MDFLESSEPFEISDMSRPKLMRDLSVTAAPVQACGCRNAAPPSNKGGMGYEGIWDYPTKIRILGRRSFGKSISRNSHLA